MWLCTGQRPELGNTGGGPIGKGHEIWSCLKRDFLRGRVPCGVLFSRSLVGEMEKASQFYLWDNLALAAGLASVSGALCPKGARSDPSAFLELRICLLGTGWGQHPLLSHSGWSGWASSPATGTKLSQARLAWKRRQKPSAVSEGEKSAGWTVSVLGSSGCSLLLPILLSLTDQKRFKNKEKKENRFGSYKQRASIAYKVHMNEPIPWLMFHCLSWEKINNATIECNNYVHTI